jgi:hypothetical protein
MVVAGAVGGFDAAGECAPGFFDLRLAREELAVLEIAGDVIGVGGEELLEILRGGGVVALIGAFDGQTVEREGVIRVSCGEFFEHLAARFLLRLRCVGFGHGGCEMRRPSGYYSCPTVLRPNGARWLWPGAGNGRMPR